jgi:hypothetical protein
VCGERQFRLSTSHHRTQRVRSALFSVFLSFVGVFSFLFVVLYLFHFFCLFMCLFLPLFFSPSLFPAVALSLSLSPAVMFHDLSKRPTSS